MAQVLTLSGFFPVSGLEIPSQSGLRCSTSALTTSGSFPILPHLFREEPQDFNPVTRNTYTEVAVSVEPSTSSPTHINPPKPPSAPSTAPVQQAAAQSNIHKMILACFEFEPIALQGSGSDESEMTEEYEDFEEDGTYDDLYDEDFDYDHAERKVLNSFKQERVKKPASQVPIRACQKNKHERVRPNRRVGHIMAEKLVRPEHRRLAQAIERVRPVFQYWAPGEQVSRSREERDMEEAIRRSRREGAISSRLTVEQLLDLQNRELSPEDYELLLLLDETIPKKTVSKDTFSSFPQTVLAQDLDTDCPVCMSPMSAGEKVTTLPCNHQYHTPCIEQWLTMSSPNCPLDGLSLLPGH